MADPEEKLCRLVSQFGSDLTRKLSECWQEESYEVLKVCKWGLNVCKIKRLHVRESAFFNNWGYQWQWIDDG